MDWKLNARAVVEMEKESDMFVKFAYLFLRNNDYTVVLCVILDTKRLFIDLLLSKCCPLMLSYFILNFWL